ncbi:MAG: methylenetetrahydrofolate reductase [NAD(P)H] [Planctomycetota bacterium]
MSFELFPPKSDAGMESLKSSVEDLAKHSPDFMTCTYGAGGSTRDRTLSVTSLVKDEFALPIASHLTCVGSTREQLCKYLQQAEQLGVDYIVALRGDPPKGESEFKPVEGGLHYANELVELIREQFPSFGILVAGYPEVHQEAPSAEVDMENLVRKVEAGADAIITQLFYDNEDYFKFEEDCRAAGIKVPVLPGLLPVLNLKQVERIASLCKARLPDDFVAKLKQKDDPDWQFEVGVEHAIHQTQGLLAAGVAGIHFYVLNKSTATNKILESVDGI